MFKSWKGWYWAICLTIFVCLLSTFIIGLVDKVFISPGVEKDESFWIGLWAFPFLIVAGVVYLILWFASCFAVFFEKPTNPLQIPQENFALDNAPNAREGFVDNYSSKTGKGCIIDKDGVSHPFVLSAFLSNAPVMFGRYVLFEPREQVENADDTVARFCYDPKRFFDYHVSKRRQISSRKLRCCGCGQVSMPTHGYCRVCGTVFQLPKYTAFDN